MHFLGFITIQILQLMVIQGDWPLLEFIYFNIFDNYKKDGSSLLNLLDLAELPIVKNSNTSVDYEMRCYIAERSVWFLRQHFPYPTILRRWWLCVFPIHVEGPVGWCLGSLFFK